MTNYNKEIYVGHGSDFNITELFDSIPLYLPEGDAEPTIDVTTQSGNTQIDSISANTDFSPVTSAGICEVGSLGVQAVNANTSATPSSNRCPAVATPNNSGGYTADPEATIAAAAYARQGLFPVPVPYRSKNAGAAYGPGWHNARIEVGQIKQYWNTPHMNVGLLLGVSKNIVDVDCDSPEAVKLAPFFLPHTPVIFGRNSKPKSHYFFAAEPLLSTTQFKDVRDTEINGRKCRQMLVEVRATGHQTVIPPSVHQSGETIYFDPPLEKAFELAPTLIRGGELLVMVSKLAAAALLAKHWPGLGSRHATELALAGGLIGAGWTVDDVTQFIVAVAEAGGGEVGKKTRNQSVQSTADRINAGETVTGWPSCGEIFGNDVISKVKNWLSISTKSGMRSGAGKTLRCADGDQTSVNASVGEAVRLGEHDPLTGKLVLSQDITLPTAEAFIRQFFHHADGRTIQSYAGILMNWKANRYVEVEDGAVKQLLLPWLTDSLHRRQKNDGQYELIAFRANPKTVAAALESIRTVAHLDSTLSSPTWLDGRITPDPRELLSTPSGNLHVPSVVLHPPTPQFFNVNSIDFDFQPNAASPVRWHEFLQQLWGADTEQIQTLQEWFGYSLVADTSMQKMLLIVGPKRSGKGTIAGVLTRLVGRANVVGPTTTSLAGNFGLQPLIGKSLAVISDARFQGRNLGDVTERLLCISGEDAISIDRKFRDAITMKLPTRFVFLTNEVPKFTDASGALASRFILLQMTQTFFGKENPNLSNELYEELPGILLWAIEGLQRLRSRGHFQQPKSVCSMIQELNELSSPVAAFVRESCVLGVSLYCPTNVLYDAWKKWCSASGREHPGMVQTFGRDLRAVEPTVETKQRRVGERVQRFYGGIALRPANALGEDTQEPDVPF